MAICALLLLALYALVGFVLLPYGVERYATRYAAGQLGAELTLGDTSFNPFLLRFEAEGLRLSKSPGSPGSPGSPASAGLPTFQEPPTSKGRQTAQEPPPSQEPPASQESPASTEPPPLLALDRLVIDLDWSSLWQQAWTVSELGLYGPRLHLRIGPDGRLDWAALMKPPAGDEGGSPPDYRLRHAVVRDGRITLVDLRGAAPASAVLGDIEVTVQDLATIQRDGEPRGHYELSATLATGGTLRAQGSLALAPALHSRGEWALADVKLPAIWPLLGHAIGADLEPVASTLSASSNYAYSARGTASAAATAGASAGTSAGGNAGGSADGSADGSAGAKGVSSAASANRVAANEARRSHRAAGSPMLELDALTLQLGDVALRASEREPTLLRLETLSADGGRLDLAARDLSFARIGLNDGAVLVKVDSEGRLGWQALGKPPARDVASKRAPDPAGATATAHPWHLRADVLRVDGVALHAADHSRALPLALDVAAIDGQTALDLDIGAGSSPLRLRALTAQLDGVRLSLAGSAAGSRPGANEAGKAAGSADSEHADTALADTAPAGTAPAGTAPADIAPADTAPASTAPADSPETLLAFDTLALDNAALDSAARSIEIDRVAAQGGHVALTLGDTPGLVQALRGDAGSDAPAGVGARLPTPSAPTPGHEGTTVPPPASGNVAASVPPPASGNVAAAGLPPASGSVATSVPPPAHVAVTGPPPAAGKVAATGAPPVAGLGATEGAQPAWNYAIGTVSVAGTDLLLRHGGFEPAISYRAEVTRATLGPVASTAAAPMQLDVQLALADGGTLQAAGTIAQDFAAAAIELQAERLPLTPLQPLLARWARLELRSGLLSTHAQLVLRRTGDGSPALHATGSASLHTVRLDEADTHERLLAWKLMRAEGVVFDTAPAALQIARIELQEPGAKLVIAKDRSINLSDVIRTGDGAVASGPPRQAHSAGAAPRPQRTADAAPMERAAGAVASRGRTVGATPRPQRAADTAPSQDLAADASPRPQHPVPFAVKIGRVDARDGVLEFSDLSLVLPFSTRITQLQGSMVNIATGGERARVEAAGEIGEFGSARVTGSLLPFAPKQFLDLKVAMDNVAVPPFSPYTATFAGRKVAEGKLWLDLEYHIENGQLLGDNEIRLADFRLGERVAAPGALDLPLDLAVALLTDSDGIISLSVPVRGDIGKPKVDVATLVREAFVSVLKRIVTAPFRALARIFGGGDDSGDVARIAFAPGSDVLPPPQREKLEAVGRALTQRPRLQLVVPGPYAPELDAQTLRRLAVRRELARVLGEDVAPGSEPGLIAFADEATQRALEAMLAKYAGDQALAELRAATPRPAASALPGSARRAPDPGQAAAKGLYPAMFAAIVERYPLPDAALRLLASRRADAIRDYLVDHAGVSARRIGTGRLEAVKAVDDGAVSTTLELDAAQPSQPLKRTTRTR